MEKLTQKEQTQIQETEKYGLEFINDEGEILLNFCALTHLAVAD